MCDLLASRKFIDVHFENNNIVKQEDYMNKQVLENPAKNQDNLIIITIKYCLY